LKHERATEEVQERAALYALGSMAQLEAKSFDAHLKEGCPACETLVRHYLKIVEGMGFAVPDAEVPAYLRDLLTSRIERESRPVYQYQGPEDNSPHEPVQEELEEYEDAVEPELYEIPREVAPSFTMPSSSRFRAGILPWVLAVLALAASISFFVLWKNADNRYASSMVNEKQRSAAAAAEAEKLKNAEIEKVRAEAESAARPDEASGKLLEILSDSQLRGATLTSQQEGVSASMTAFSDKDKKRWMVIGRLPEPPAGKSYQLWLISGDRKFNGGILEKLSGGLYFKIAEFPPGAAKGNLGAVTVEPKGGSQQPTVRAMLLGKLS
jgi:hypothetical protein